MILSCNIAPLQNRFGYEKSLRLLKDAGFDAADYSLEELSGSNSAFAGDDWEKVANEYREIAERIGIRINQTHAPAEFHKFSDQENYKNFIYPRICRSVEISGIFGASVSVVHPIHYLYYHDYKEELFNMNMEFYSSLIPICEKHNIRVGVENMWRHDARRRYITFDTCGTTEEFIRYIDTLNSPWLVATLDVGHVGLPIGDDECWDFVRALGHDRLKSLHIHDNNYKDDQHLLPYLGKIDWVKLCQALGEIDYTGDFTFEVSGYMSAGMDDAFVPVTLRYMADIGRHMIDLIDASRPKS